MDYYYYIESNAAYKESMLALLLDFIDRKIYLDVESPPHTFLRLLHSKSDILPLFPSSCIHLFKLRKRKRAHFRRSPTDLVFYTSFEVTVSCNNVYADH